MQMLMSHCMVVKLGTVQDTVAAMPLLVTLCRLSMVSKALETLKVALNILGRC